MDIDKTEIEDSLNAEMIKKTEKLLDMIKKGKKSEVVSEISQMDNKDLKSIYNWLEANKKGDSVASQLKGTITIVAI